MKVYPYLAEKHIFLNVHRTDKEAVLRFVAEIFARDQVVDHPQGLFEHLQKREKTMSTGIGKGIGIPHAASEEVTNPAVLLVRLADPIDFDALDDLPVDIVMALVVPTNQTALHLRILAGISRLCEKNAFLTMVRNAVDPKTLLNEIRLLEQEIAFH